MDIQQFLEFSPTVIGIVPVIVGLVQVAKGLGIPERISPIAAIGLGIGLLALTGIAWQAIVLQGIIAGLAASGLYSGIKKVANG